MAPSILISYQLSHRTNPRERDHAEMIPALRPAVPAPRCRGIRISAPACLSVSGSRLTRPLVV
jgi:hypothetical protein